MKAIVPWASAFLGTTLTAALAFADPYYHPALPDAASGPVGPGHHLFGAGKRANVPSYWFRPTGEPLTPYFPAINNCGPNYVTHPYVRGPRDFFMWRENLEDQMRRDVRPALVP
jgi:hypothetical protein